MDGIRMPVKMYTKQTLSVSKRQKSARRELNSRPYTVPCGRDYLIDALVLLEIVLKHHSKFNFQLKLLLIRLYCHPVIGSTPLFHPNNPTKTTHPVHPTDLINSLVQ
jgi:hypothetical protein